jgi:hypothetical protein
MSSILYTKAGPAMRGLIVLQTLCVLGLGLTVAPSRLRAQGSVREQAQPGTDSPVFAYTDDRGRLVHVHRLLDVPSHLREHARRVDRPVAVAEPQPDSALDWAAKQLGAAGGAVAEPVMYRYQASGGRVVYTNLPESVPAAQRGNARIDLAHVPLNTELGAALDERLQSRYDELHAAGVCQKLAAAVDEPLWRRIPREHPAQTICGGVLLMFLLLTPWMLTRGWGEQWARVFKMAVPVIGLLGIGVFVLTRSTQSLSQLRERAKPCDSSAWTSASHQPDGLSQHAKLVHSLETEAKLLDQIHRE